MAQWKQILLKFFGVGFGIGVGFAVCVGIYGWYSSRPVPQQPWNAKAITATFELADTRGEDHHLRFRYFLENHTETDYKIEDTRILHVDAVVGEKDGLAGEGMVKFEDQNIFLPAKQRVLVNIELPGYRYPGSDAVLHDTADERKKYRDAVKEYVNKELPKLNGFAAFDEIERYQINFPNGWRWNRSLRMANTSIQTEVEDWVRRNWMPTQYGTKFARERLRLSSGGVFDFDAVSEDHSIVAVISTSSAKTSGLKHAVGKMQKLRADMLFLTMVEAKRRIIVLTERDMCDQCEKEFAAGRVPREIEFVCAIIPEDLRARLVEARAKASIESSGKAAAV